MENYGSYIAYDVSSQPITMRVHGPAVAGVTRLFKENYKLKFSSIETADGVFVFEFDKTVDAHTFERHLKTATPAEYELVSA